MGILCNEENSTADSLTISRKLKEYTKGKGTMRVYIFNLQDTEALFKEMEQKDNHFGAKRL